MRFVHAAEHAVHLNAVVTYRLIPLFICPFLLSVMSFLLQLLDRLLLTLLDLEISISLLSQSLTLPPQQANVRVRAPLLFLLLDFEFRLQQHFHILLIRV